MGQSRVEELVIHRNRRLRWETCLPKPKAWMQTLILLPFGLPVGNFLASSWRFSVAAIGEDRQYLLGVLSMGFNLLLPSLFFAVVFHWGWFIWRSTATPTRWYPQAPALRAGCYATLTIAASFGAVGLFTNSLGVCGTPGWNEIGQSLLCNLDGYGFEDKSWFGAWFIVAAYCYQVQAEIEDRVRMLGQKMLRRRHSTPLADDADFTTAATAHGDGTPEDRCCAPTDSITAELQD